MAKKYYDVCMHCGQFESQSKRNAGISTVRYGTARQSKMIHGFGNVLYGTTGIRTST